MLQKVGNNVGLETEYKFLVSKEKFERIMDRIRMKYPELEIKERLQINYYYDTDDHYLLDRHTTLRARQIGDDIRLEMKEAVISSKDYSEAVETSRKLERLTGDITLEKGKFAWIPFSLQGSLVTRRYSIRPSDSLSIDFDINYYLGKCDYEIEMEFTEKAQKATSILVEKLGLMKYKNTIGGKARRFFMWKSEIFKD